ncbi:MAG: HNH endonuclease signature motif containing protein [Sterolibacterium sp.]|nr:HNH endonuclease signature motif containing protein [Sterolibacterium sp.]
MDRNVGGRLIRAFCLFAALLLSLSLAFASQHRSTSTKNAFKRENPCPETGKPRGPCPGWIIDHVIPLDCGGPDTPANMQWQTVLEAKLKDRVERKDCKQGTRLTE